MPYIYNHLIRRVHFKLLREKFNEEYGRETSYLFDQVIYFKERKRKKKKKKSYISRISIKHLDCQVHVFKLEDRWGTYCMLAYEIVESTYILTD
jgi:hypothetical protein